MKGILTPRQHEIAELLAWGASAKEIALILTLSTDTVLRHIKNIKKRLNLSKTTEISAYIFCTDYEVSVEYDRLGNIKKVMSMLVFLILVGFAEFQQIDCFRGSTMRVAKTRITTRRVRRDGHEYNLIYDTTLE